MSKHERPSTVSKLKFHSNRFQGSVSKLAWKDEVSLQKFGSTTDITGIIDYLINSNSNFINGSVFVVDGGQIRSF